MGKMLSERWWNMCAKTVLDITISSNTVQEAASPTPSHGRLIVKEHTRCHFRSSETI